MNELVIEVDKYYKTRGGRKAHVVEYCGGEYYCYKGVVYHEDGYEQEVCWTKGGFFYKEGDCSGWKDDLIEAWDE